MLCEERHHDTEYKVVVEVDISPLVIYAVGSYKALLLCSGCSPSSVVCAVILSDYGKFL